MAIAVLLADDSEILRKAIRKLLETAPDFEVVGEVPNFRQTLRATRELKPQIVVMDIYMPDESAVAPSEVSSQLESLGCCLIAISYSNEEDTKKLAATYGARKLLDKMRLASDLLPALEECAAEILSRRH